MFKIKKQSKKFFEINKLEDKVVKFEKNGQKLTKKHIRNL